jgi:endogenous inhibitor of DNA gyrase (YacG/DUF329 family)
MRMTTAENRIVKCPQCHQAVTWDDNPSRPFCSERCRLIDLGNWASGNYRIASDDVDVDDMDESGN